MIIDVNIEAAKDAGFRKAKILAVNIAAGYVDFQWVDANGNPIDQGISTVPLNDELVISESEMEKIRTAISAAASVPQGL